MTRNVLRRRVRRDQRGVILLLAVPGIVVAVASLALSIDIGRQVLEKRSDQKVADLAALDAVRDLPAAQAEAEASAVRNGFDLADPDTTLVAERGSVDSQRIFSLDPTGDAVRVIVTSVVDYIFLPGRRTITATAVAQMTGSTPTTVPTSTSSTTTTTIPCTPPDPACPAAVPAAGFRIGSTLASVDTSKANLLNRVLGRWMRGAASGGGTADVVGWQGLLTSDVTLSALRDHLELLDAGVQFGTVDQLLDADLTVSKLAQATANALNAAGDSNAALYAGPAGIVAQSTSTATFKLRRLIEVEAGSGDAALATRFKAFHLLTGSAMVANGTNLVSVPDIGITIPGLGTTGITLKVIEGQKTYIGPAGGGVSTGQVEMTLTPTLDRGITVGGLTGAKLTGSFPFSVAAAGATGTLSTITCAAPGAGIRVAVDLKPFVASTSSTLGVSATVLGVSAPLFSVATTGGVGATDPTPENVDYAYPGEFTPTATGKRVGASPIGLDTMSTFSATATPLGATPVPVGLSAAVANDLKVVVGLLDEHVMATLHRTLGVSIGTADVSALKDAFDTGCASPVPTPATTTTTTTTTTTPPATTPPTTTASSPKLVG